MPRAARWAEFLALFVGVPVVMAVFLPPNALFPALFAFTLGGLALIRATGDFDLRSFEVRAAPATPVPGLRPGMSALIRPAEAEGE